MWSTVFAFHFTSLVDQSVSIILFYHPAALQTLLWKYLLKIFSAYPAVSLNSPGIMAKLFALKKIKLLIQTKVQDSRWLANNRSRCLYNTEKRRAGKKKGIVKI